MRGIRLPSFAHSANLVVQDEPKATPLPEGTSALKTLQMGYRGEVRLTPQQVRCAEAALAYESPRMSAVAVGYLTGEDFYSRLERAIERSNGVKLIEAQAVEVDDGLR